MQRLPESVFDLKPGQEVTIPVISNCGKITIVLRRMYHETPTIRYQCYAAGANGGGMTPDVAIEKALKNAYDWMRVCATR